MLAAECLNINQPCVNKENIIWNEFIEFLYKLYYNYNNNNF